MKSTATSVAGYLDEQPAEWQPTLRKLRAACRRELKGYTEKMSYGMPSYLREGTIDLNFALQAAYLESSGVQGASDRAGGSESRQGLHPLSPSRTG